MGTLEVEPDARSPCREPMYGLQFYFQFGVLKMCRTIGRLGLQIYFQSEVLEMKNYVVGAIVMKNRVVRISVGSQRNAIWRAGSQCREPVQGLGVSILLPV